MTEKRYQDDGTHLFQFMETISIRCPKCGGYATVKCEGFPNSTQILSAKLVCLNCAFTEEQAVGFFVYGVGPFDPFFRYPLWCVCNFRGHVLWAYNRDHLRLMKQVVRAELRESQPNVSHGLANRLPKWMLDKKNRKGVLKAIEELERRYD